MPPAWLTRILTWIIALAVGAAYGVAGTIAHSYLIGWFPLGLVLATIGCGALLIAVRALTEQRAATLATGLGMMAAVLIFSGQGPGGSVVVPQAADGQSWTLGMTWTVLVAVMALLAVAWPDLGRSARVGDGADAPAHAGRLAP